MKKRRYTEVYDKFIEDIDVEDIETIEELQELLDDWLNPNIGKDKPEVRERVIETLATDFWGRIIESIEYKPKAIAMEYFPKDREKQELIEKAIERAARFSPEERERRFGAFYGTLSSKIKAGELDPKEVKEIWQKLKGGEL